MPKLSVKHLGWAQQACESVVKEEGKQKAAKAVQEEAFSSLGGSIISSGCDDFATKMQQFLRSRKK